MREELKMMLKNIDVESALGILALAAVVFAFWPPFMQSYYVPKLSLFFLGAAVLGLVRVWRGENLFYTRPQILFFVGLALLAGIGMWKGIGAGTSLKAGLLFAAAALYLGYFQSTTDQQRKEFEVAVVVFALMQSILVFARVPTGTFGNAEFLSTFILIGFFLSLRMNVRFLWLPLLVALALLQVKSSLFLLAVFYVRRLWLGLVPLGLVALYFEGADLRARVLTYLASLPPFIESPIIGHGLGQFKNQYVDGLFHLFSWFPALIKPLSAYTGPIHDAHNIFAHYAVEGGIIGIGVAAVYLRSSLLPFVQRPDEETYCGFVLGAKALITAVFSSISGLLLAAYFGKVARPLNAIVIPRPLLAVAAVAMIWATVMCGSEIFVTRGMAQLRSRDLPHAEKSFRMALKFDRWNDRAVLGLAYLAASQGQKQKAVAFLNRCEDRTVNSRRKASFVRRDIGDSKRAEQDLVYLAQAFPDHMTNYRVLAELAFKRKDFRASRALAEKALALTPREPLADLEVNRSKAAKVLLELQRHE